MNSLTTVGGIVKNADEAGPPPLPRKPTPKTARRARSENSETGGGVEREFKARLNDHALEASNRYARNSRAIGPTARKNNLSTIVPNPSALKAPTPIPLPPPSTKDGQSAEVHTPSTRNPTDNISTTLSVAPSVSSFDINVRNPANRFGIAVLEKLFHEESRYYSSSHFAKVFKKGIEAIAKSEKEIHTMKDALALPDITTWMARAIVNEKKIDLGRHHKLERKFDDDSMNMELKTRHMLGEPAKLNFVYNGLFNETTSKDAPNDSSGGTMSKWNLNSSLENVRLRTATRPQQSKQYNAGHQRSVASISTLSAPSLNTSYSILKNTNRLVSFNEEAMPDKPRELSRKEKAQARVQEYLMRIDMKIQGGKQLKRAHSMGDLLEGRALMRPWDLMENDQLGWNQFRFTNSGEMKQADTPITSRAIATMHRSSPAYEVQRSAAPFDESSSSDDVRGTSLVVAHQRQKEIQQYESALREAQKTVQALENTIELLEEASQLKNQTINQLKNNVEELQREIEESSRKSEKLMESEEKMNMLASMLKDKDCSIESLKKKLIDESEKLAKSEVALSEARNTLTNKEKEMERMNREAELERTNLMEKLERYSKEVTSSLESNTEHIEIISKEKDALIDSLKEKIIMLEECQRANTAKEGELSEKMSTLAIALAEKDKQISELQEEIYNAHQLKNKTALSSGKRGKSKKEDGAIRGGRSQGSFSKSTSPRPNSPKVCTVLEEDEPSRILPLKSEGNKRTSYRLEGTEFESAHKHKDVVKSPTNRIPISPEFPRGVYESRDDY
ncbi:hypothetical protein ACHAXS_008200 [Conticribra weissflogii]